MSNVQCQNCHAEITGNYCANCGEKRFLNSELTLLALIKQLLVSLTDIDGKLLKSLRLLLFKPGVLTCDYLKGRRQNRLNPFALFVLVNIAYFILVSFIPINTFTTPLRTHTHSLNFIHQELAKQLVEQELAARNETLESYSDRFNRRTNVQSKSLIILLIPIFAVFVYIVNIWRNGRRVIGAGMAENSVVSLIFAGHFISFVLAFNILLVASLSLIVSLVNFLFGFDFVKLFNSEIFFSFILAFVFCCYLLSAVRTVYGDKLWVSSLKVLFMLVGLYWALLFYRVILFFTVFYSL